MSKNTATLSFDKVIDILYVEGKIAKMYMNEKWIEGIEMNLKLDAKGRTDHVQFGRKLHHRVGGIPVNEKISKTKKYVHTTSDKGE